MLLFVADIVAETGSLPENIDGRHPLVIEYYKREIQLQSIRRQFLRESGIKISEDHINLLNWNVHLVLFNQINNVRDEFSQFKECLEKEYTTVDKYIKASYDFDLRATQKLKATPEFIKFCNASLKELFYIIDQRLNVQKLLNNTQNFQIECKSKVLHLLGNEQKYEDIDYLLVYKELYLLEHCNKNYVSIDLKQANFNALRLLDPNLVLGAETWESLVIKLADDIPSSLLSKSKMVRARLLGKLEHERIKCIEAHILDLILLV